MAKTSLERSYRNCAWIWKLPWGQEVMNLSYVNDDSVDFFFHFKQAQMIEKGI